MICPICQGELEIVMSRFECSAGYFENISHFFEGHHKNNEIVDYASNFTLSDGSSYGLDSRNNKTELFFINGPFKEKAIRFPFYTQMPIDMIQVERLVNRLLTLKTFL